MFANVFRNGIFAKERSLADVLVPEAARTQGVQRLWIMKNVKTVEKAFLVIRAGISKINVQLKFLAASKDVKLPKT